MCTAMIGMVGCRRSSTARIDLAVMGILKNAGDLEVPVVMIPGKEDPERRSDGLHYWTGVLDPS